ncbi:MAG: hypothetical protein ACYTF3_03765 [Planctomycetota bacterium]|jgi:hypothetical protein
MREAWKLALEIGRLFPATLPLGGFHTADIDIPNSPGMSGHLLLSSGFDREQGFAPDGWRTGLAIDTLFTWSQGQALTTTLDAVGQGSVSFQLPNKPGLIGETVHARFLVPDPAKPGSLWTLSSIGVGGGDTLIAGLRRAPNA